MGALASRPELVPAVSIVIASNRARSLLDACLASVLPQCEGWSAEVIVARPSHMLATDARDRDDAKKYPTVRFVSAPPDASIPVLRGVGLSVAHGELVALLEDHCIAGDGWLESILCESERATLVGGGVSNARCDRLLEWAAYFSEYGFFSPTRPESAGGVPLLTGANVAYQRVVVARVAKWASEGEWENVIHDRLASCGYTSRFVRSAVVYQNMRYSFREFCADRLRHGFAYARKRLAEQPSARRPVLFVLTPALPLIQAWRVGNAIWTAGNRMTFLRALPITLAFFAAWSAGEATGYLRGRSLPSRGSAAGGSSDSSRARPIDHV